MRWDFSTLSPSLSLISLFYFLPSSFKKSGQTVASRVRPPQIAVRTQTCGLRGDARRRIAREKARTRVATRCEPAALPLRRRMKEWIEHWVNFRFAEISRKFNIRKFGKHFANLHDFIYFEVFSENIRKIPTELHQNWTQKRQHSLTKMIFWKQNRKDVTFGQI